MPVKRRIDKRRATIPLEVWAGIFETGDDFFGELEDFGLVEPVAVPPAEREAAQARWDEALRGAWAKHGADFMRDWCPTGARTLPWAAEVYGMPEEMEI